MQEKFHTGMRHKGVTQRCLFEIQMSAHKEILINKVA